MIIRHRTCCILLYIFSSLSPDLCLYAKPGPSAPIKADLTGAGIGRCEVQLSKLPLWPGVAVARHKSTNIRVSGHTAPVQRPSGSDLFYCWTPYRHHHRNGQENTQGHICSGRAVELAENVFQTLISEGHWGWSLKRADSLNMWH